MFIDGGDQHTHRGVDMRQPPWNVVVVVVKRPGITGSSSSASPT